MTIRQQAPSRHLLDRPYLIPVLNTVVAGPFVVTSQTLTLQDRAERDVPGLVLDFGGDGSGYVLTDDDRAARERGERCDDVANVGILKRHRDRWLLRLLRR